MNDYYKIEVTADPASADALDLLAAELADRGFESFEPSEDGSAMTAYVPAALYSQESVDEAVSAVPMDVVFTSRSEFVEGQDWNSEWEKNYFKPIVVDGRVVVHSTFHTDVPEAAYDITIDPRMAFGTGHHATTTLMMRSLLDGGDVAGASVIDMGTGTGILAILAMMLGAKAAGNSDRRCVSACRPRWLGGCFSCEYQPQYNHLRHYRLCRFDETGRTNHRERFLCRRPPCGCGSRRSSRT